jgi:outer membrane protein TolC
MNKLLYTIIFAFILTHSFGQVKSNAEIKNIITASFSYFSKVKEIENLVLTAKEKVAITELSNKPTIDFFASYNYLRPKIEVPIEGRNFQFAPINNLASGFTSSYPLFDFGRQKNNIAKSKSELQWSEHQAKFSRIKLAHQIAQLYYNIMYLKHAIKVEDSIIHFLNYNKSIAVNKFKNGDNIQLDTINIQSNIDAEENIKIDINNKLQKQLILLEFTSGIKEVKESEFNFMVEENEMKNAFELAQRNNPEFQMSENKIQQQKIALQGIKLENKPMVSLHAATGVKNGYVPAVNELKFNYNAGISFIVPVYNFGKTKQNIKLQESIIKQQELEHVSLNETFNKDIKQVLIDISSNQELIKNSESQIKSTAAAMKIVSSKYQNGTASYLDLIAVSNSQQRAELSKLQYQYQLSIAEVELAKLMGLEYWK